MNKYSSMVLTSSIIKSGQIFIILYLLTILSPSNLYFIESILIIIISFSLILFKKDFSQIKNVTKKY
jgi:hypothetical protein